MTKVTALGCNFIKVPMVISRGNSRSGALILRWRAASSAAATAYVYVTVVSIPPSPTLHSGDRSMASVSCCCCCNGIETGKWKLELS